MKFLVYIQLLITLYCFNFPILPPAICDNSQGVTNNFCDFSVNSSQKGGFIGDEAKPVANYLIASSDGKIYRSKRDGIEFSKVTLPWDQSITYPNHTLNGIGFGNIFSLETTANEYVLASGDRYHLFASYDRGKTWHRNQNIIDTEYINPATKRVYEGDIRDVAVNPATGRIIAVGSRTMVLYSDSKNPLASFSLYDCNRFTLVTEEQGRCNIFFKGIEFYDGYFVLWGSPQAFSDAYIAFWSNDNGETWHQLPAYEYLEVEIYNYSDSISTMKAKQGVWFIHRGYSIFKTSSSNPRSSYIRLKSLDDHHIHSSDFDVSPEGHVISVTRDASLFLDRGDGDGLEACGSFSFTPEEVCNIIDGSYTKVLHSKGVWRILTADGWFYYSTRIDSWKRYRLALDSLNDIKSF